METLRYARSGYQDAFTSCLKRNVLGMETASLFESIQPRYPEFNGQVALVTGSGRGIGKGIALRLAREGMNVVIHGLDPGEVAQTTREFEALGVDTLGIAADFNEADSVERLFEATLERFGTVDLLVNNAADLRREHLLNGDLPLLDYQLNVSLRAPYLCAYRAVEIMRPLRRGNIVNISSVGGIRAHWRGLPYDVPKGGIDAMTRAMAIELARDGIRMNAVAPGAIHIERTPPLDSPEMQAVAERVPIPRFGTTLEIGAAVAFLASSDAAYITGQILYVDGGLTVQLSPFDQPV
jgi:NAD(P)-dependent dehydrogenase (short-subunit alcohol dehydrogenase family)